VSRSVTVPDFGDSGSLYQRVEIAEPGEPGYPTPELPEGDPWAPAVNATIREIAEAEPEPLPGPDPEVGSWPGWSDPAMLSPEREAAPEPEAEPEAEI
jgi:hypothetical protein